MVINKPEHLKPIVEKNLKRLTHFSEQDFEIFWDCLFYSEFKAREMMLQMGEVASRLSFIIDGITRIYIQNDDKEYTLRFNFPGSFCSSYKSFSRQEPSAVAIEAITPVKLFFLSPKSLHRLYQEADNAYRIGKAMLEILYISREEKEIAFATKSTEENYFELLNTQPELFQRIPQKYIASYLGITPVSLSRIRNKIWKKN